MERETGLGLDRDQTWPGHVTTTFVSPQTAARHQTVEKTGELWMAAGEMILHILSLVSTLCLLPSGWLKRSGLLGTTELPIKHFYWPTTLALRWQWRKRKCGYLDPFLSHYLITAQCSVQRKPKQKSAKSEARPALHGNLINLDGNGINNVNKTASESTHSPGKVANLSTFSEAFTSSHQAKNNLEMLRILSKFSKQIICFTLIMNTQFCRPGFLCLPLPCGPSAHV